MTAASPTRRGPVAVIGAGRWARELARTLSARPGVTRVVMHSSSHAEALRTHLASDPSLAAIGVTGSYADLAQSAPAAVVIANAARDHAHAAEWAMAAGVPALVEKPFTASLADTRRLIERAQRDGSRLYAAHVLMFAEYLPQFAARLAEHPAPRALRVEWRDPRQETRNGERKRFDSGVPVYLDCLPHIVSVLETLWPRALVTGRSLRFMRGGARLEFSLNVGGMPCELLLERNADVRARVLSTGTGGLSLDFSHEPGTISRAGESSVVDPMWGSRPRPMAAMLDAFMSAAAGAPADPRLDAGVALRAAELIDWATPVYNAQRLDWLETALIEHAEDGADVAYAMTELLSSGASIPTEALELRIGRVHEIFRAGRDRGWLAALVAARDPASMLDETAAPRPH